MLQALREPGAPHRLAGHAFGAQEGWRTTPAGLISCHWREKAPARPRVPMRVWKLTVVCACCACCLAESGCCGPCSQDTRCGANVQHRGARSGWGWRFRKCAQWRRPTSALSSVCISARHAVAKPRWATLSHSVSLCSGRGQALTRLHGLQARLRQQHPTIGPAGACSHGGSWLAWLGPELGDQQVVSCAGLVRQVRMLQARLAEGDQRLKELVRVSQRQLDAASAEVPAHCLHTHVAPHTQTGPVQCDSRVYCLPAPGVCTALSLHGCAGGAGCGCAGAHCRRARGEGRGGGCGLAARPRAGAARAAPRRAGGGERRAPCALACTIGSSWQRTPAPCHYSQITKRTWLLQPLEPAYGPAEL